MINIFCPLLQALARIAKNDPVYNCGLYKLEGCAHVDGVLCDLPTCSMLEECKHKNPIK